MGFLLGCLVFDCATFLYLYSVDSITRVMRKLSGNYLSTDSTLFAVRCQRGVCHGKELKNSRGMVRH